MTVKKHSLAELIKGKGYYVLLFVGVLAIGAVALIGTKLSSNQDDSGKDFVDLNEQPDNNIAAEDGDNQLADNSLTSEGIVNNEQGDNSSDDALTNDYASNDPTEDSLLEFDVITEEEENGIDLAEANTNEAEVVVPEVVETTGKTVQADKDTTPVLKPESLSFKEDNGLLWPVDGNVLMNYSMDHTVYHATLMQWKCNPAVIIEAKVGTEVVAAARGIVSSIEENNNETGLTVTTNIGDGYSLVYGQLKDVSLKVGDEIKEGSILGTIAEPSKYYVVEGSNLYFEVLKDDATVNPMQLLRE